MHLPNLIARWAAHEDLLDRRQATTALAATTKGGVIGSIIDSITSEVKQTTTAAATKATTTPAQTTADTNTDDQPTTTQQQTTAQTKATTTATPTTNKASTTAKPSTTLTKAATTAHPTDSSVQTLTDSVPTDGTSSIPVVTSTSKSNSNNSGSFSGIKGSQVGMAVGIVVGIAGGFAIIIGAIYFWRRHQRRKQMERLGSMEELTRGPSPPLLSRSLTQGRNGPRQPIDDDDDDFLTPMDTLPNTHRLDDYSQDDHEHYQGHDREMSMYSTDGDYFHTSETGAPQLPPSYPVAPPAAAVAANARFYTGEMDNSSMSSSPTNSGAIPAWSSMNKYAAYTPGANTAAAASQTQAYGAPGAAVAASNRTSSYGRVSSFSRPGAGYRGTDNPSPSPSTQQAQQPASGLGDFKF